MPTYQYACTKCGEQLEVVQKFSDDPLTECPACAGTLRKVFSPVGVVFKGSGFYKTDSRTKSKSSSSNGSGESKSGDSTPAKSDSTSSDTKADTKTADKSTSASSTTGSGQVA